MWHPDEISFDLDEAGTEAPIVTLIAHAPGGDLYALGELVAFGRRVEVEKALPSVLPGARSGSEG